ncbi:MAG: restriction system protein [Acidobacteriota bacterium]|jgi:restriction system protein|nr:restriction system protein [Acidobacteriota bacterium]
MSGIWSYSDHLPGVASRIGFQTRDCPHCKTSLQFLGAIDFKPAMSSTRVWACPACGWWKIEAERDSSGPTFIPNVDAITLETRYAHATLQNFSVKDWSGPLSDLERYLLVRRSALGEVPPRLVEETVADVFKNLGYSPELTAYSKDGGIDLFLTEPRSGERIAVQVKRYKDRVGVELVRSFVGAMAFEGVTRGIYIATSGYTRDARTLETSDLVALELRDGEWLLDALSVTQRAPYSSIHDESAPYWRLVRDFGSLPLIEYQSSAVDRPFGW